MHAIPERTKDPCGRYMERDDGNNWRIDFTKPKMPSVLQCGDILFAYCSIDHIIQAPYRPEPFNNGIIRTIELWFSGDNGDFQPKWDVENDIIELGYDVTDNPWLFDAVEKGNTTGLPHYKYLLMRTKIDQYKAVFLNNTELYCTVKFRAKHSADARRWHTRDCSAIDYIVIDGNNCTAKPGFTPCKAPKVKELPKTTKFEPLVWSASICFTVVCITFCVVASLTRDASHHLPRIRIVYLPKVAKLFRAKKKIPKPKKTTAATAPDGVGKSVKSPKPTEVTRESFGFIKSLMDFQSMKDLEKKRCAATELERAAERSETPTKSGQSGQSAKTGNSGKSGNSGKAGNSEKPGSSEKSGKKSDNTTTSTAKSGKTKVT